MESPSTTITGPTPSADDLSTMRSFVYGFQVSQALHVVVRLGIADILRDGPQSNAQLAALTGSDASALGRVMRFLVANGIFDEPSPDRFALNTLGAALRTDIPESIAAWAGLYPQEAVWRAWGYLEYTVRTGETAYDHVHGMGRFEHLQRLPEQAAEFQAAMSSGVAAGGQALVDAYDFSGVRRVMDVGGGSGSQLAILLKAYPHLTGVLFDLPEMVATAKPVLEAAGILDRCEMIGGDFFTSVPAGADVYILRRVIHDWDDARSVDILRQCRKAMNPGSRLLVIEQRIASDPHAALLVRRMDIQMLVATGGKERTDGEYAELFEKSGFQLASITPLEGTIPTCIFEGVPKDLAAD
jgi:predicted O-methyltransferase YrrM